MLCWALIVSLSGLLDGDTSNSIAFAETDLAQIQQATSPFSIYSCTKDEFISYCLMRNIKGDRVEYVWDIIRGQYSVDELSRKYCVEPETIKHDRWRYKKKLKN